MGLPCSLSSGTKSKANKQEAESEYHWDYEYEVWVVCFRTQFARFCLGS